MNKIDTFNFISEDIRKRKYLLPSTVVKTEGTVIGEENLLKQKALQIALREFDVTALENKSGKHSSVLLDFGCELHGGIRILTAKMAKPTRIRITFGESISEATSDIGYKYAGNDHSPRDFETTIPRLADIEFGQTGFRYVRIELLEDEARLNIKSIIGVFVYREIDPKETRRHTSLDNLFDQGHFIEDQDSDLSQYGVRMENILKMRKALSTLTDKQRNAIIARHVDSLSFNEIGRRMGVTGKTVIAHFKDAEKKIKKYYNKHRYR